MSLGFEVSRFVHYLALLVAFGASLFPYYTWRSGEQAPESVVRLIGVLLPLAALAALLSGAAWFACVANNMSDSPTGFLDPAIASAVLETQFGRLWIGRAVFGAFLFAVVAVRPARSSFAVLLSAFCLVSLAGTGHAQSAGGVLRDIQEGSDGIHLLAAGAWLGALVPLAIVSSPATYDEARHALSRFSGVGYLAVAALLVTGTLDAFVLIGSWAGLVGSGYGRLLLVKAALFLIMIVLAATNRFVLIPQLARNHRDNGSDVLARLRRHVAFEQVLGIAVIGIVSVLGTLVPPSAP